MTWSYYGLQAWQYLFGKNQVLELTYKTVFCLIIIAGASANVGNAVDFSDAALFAMSIPNLIGVYFMIPIIRREYAKFQHFAERVDKGSSLEEADASAEKAFPDQ